MIRKALMILLVVAAVAAALLTRVTVTETGWQFGDGELKESRYWAGAMAGRPNRHVNMIVKYRGAWRPLERENMAYAHLEFRRAGASYVPGMGRWDPQPLAVRHFALGPVMVWANDMLWFDVWKRDTGSGDYYAEPSAQMSVRSDDAFQDFTEPTQEADGRSVSIWVPGRFVLLLGYGSSLLLAAWPVLAFICGPLRRRRRRKKGLCVRCGYNLTGNVSGTCPECGASCGADDAHANGPQSPTRNT
jgi:hypothetical protein